MLSRLPAPGPTSALLLDAAGTVLHPAAPIAETYAHFARDHGVDIDPITIRSRFGPAMHEAKPLRRHTPDWRAYWAAVVARCTGSDDPQLLDDLLAHFREPDAWTLAPGAEDCCRRVRARGMKLALVSNWDLHLRSLCERLGIDRWFDVIVISAEEQLEKPDPRLFWRACARLGVEPHAAVHVGDSIDDDLAGASAAGCAALLIGRDVTSFEALAARLLGEPTHTP